MYPVTQDFMQQMKAPDRKLYGKVQIDYTDPFLDQSIQVEANEQAPVSYPGQTADGLPEPYAKIASLDGSWVLDGTYALAPTLAEFETHQMGWWGLQLADVEGYFAEPYPSLAVFFFSRPIHSLRVIGDSKRAEYPVDFEIILYDEYEDILHVENVTGNDKIVWTKTIIPVTQVVKAELTITKWSHPDRQVKILEFFTSISEVYEGSDLISVNLIEEREISMGGLPIGNIAANEISIKLHNRNRKFDAGNINSPLYNLLKPNRKIRAWLGAETGEPLIMEYVPLGIFWSGDWTAPAADVYVQTTGRDRLEYLRRTEYILEGIISDMSLYDLAVDVFEDAGLEPGEYWIDEELQDYIVPFVKLDPQAHREVLRKIAEACLGQVYCDRHGVVRVEGTQQISELYAADANEFAGVSYVNQVTDGVEEPFAKIASLDGSWNLEGEYVLAPEIETPGMQMGWWGEHLADAGGYFTEPYPTLFILFFEKAIGAVRVVGDSLREEYPVDFIIRVYDGFENLLSEQIVTGNMAISLDVPIPENPTNAAKIELVILKWSHAGRQAKIVELKDMVSILEIIPSECFRKDNPAKWSEVANYIEVETQPIDENGEVLEKIKIIAKDDDNITENGLLKFTFPANSLIQTAEAAQEIADRLLEIYKDPRRNLELDWIGNPALLLGNTVSVVDSSEQNIYRVAKQEIDCAGGLRASLTGRRVV